MEIYNLSPGSWGSNCYILISGNRAAVIDPSADAQRIVDFVAKKNATVENIILTHGHFDHIVSLDALRDSTLAPALIHKDDAEMLSDGEKNAHSFFFGYGKRWRPAEKILEDGDKIVLGGETVEVISTPGHSKGSICLLCSDKLITGDTLFANGFGRYDLYGGDVNQLADSSASLRALDPTLTVYPGHGDSARLGDALDSVAYYF